MMRLFLSNQCKLFDLLQLRFEHCRKSLKQSLAWGFSWFTLIFKHVLLECWLLWLSYKVCLLGDYLLYPVFWLFLNHIWRTCARLSLWECSIARWMPPSLASSYATVCSNCTSLLLVQMPQLSYYYPSPHSYDSERKSKV